MPIPLSYRVKLSPRFGAGRFPFLCFQHHMTDTGSENGRSPMKQIPVESFFSHSEAQAFQQFSRLPFSGFLLKGKMAFESCF